MIRFAAVLDDGHKYIAEISIGQIAGIVDDGTTTIVRLYDGTQLRSPERANDLLEKIQAEI